MKHYRISRARTESNIAECVNGHFAPPPPFFLCPLPPNYMYFHFSPNTALPATRIHSMSTMQVGVQGSACLIYSWRFHPIFLHYLLTRVFGEWKLRPFHFYYSLFTPVAKVMVDIKGEGKTGTDVEGEGLGRGMKMKAKIKREKEYLVLRFSRTWISGT